VNIWSEAIKSERATFNGMFTNWFTCCHSKFNQILSFERTFWSKRQKWASTCLSSTLSLYDPTLKFLIYIILHSIILTKVTTSLQACRLNNKKHHFPPDLPSLWVSGWLAMLHDEGTICHFLKIFYLLEGFFFLKF